MSDSHTGGTPAGWYEDGVTAGQERYWDGAQWTDQFRPLAPVAPPAPATPAYSAAPAAPAAQAYPAYQPAPAGAPRAPGKGMSKGAIIGIIAGAAALIVAIILILGFTVWGWGGGGGGGAASNAQQQQFLSNVKGSSEVSASDSALVEAGNNLCDAGRTIIAGDYLGGMTQYLELFNSQLDLVTLGNVALYAMEDLCPDVQAQLEQLGESFTF